MKSVLWGDGNGKMEVGCKNIGEK